MPHLAADETSQTGLADFRIGEFVEAQGVSGRARGTALQQLDQCGDTRRHFVHTVRGVGESLAPGPPPPCLVYDHWGIGVRKLGSKNRLSAYKGTSLLTPYAALVRAAVGASFLLAWFRSSFQVDLPLRRGGLRRRGHVPR